jgi:tetratricopeptide (TPR) repeat protein
VGTVLYMSPEQASGLVVDARSDLFSFGVVLYELVTGRRPFGGDDLVSAMYALANEPPAPLARFASGVPPELERITTKLLEKRPADRYQSAHEVLTDLHRLQGRHVAATGAPSQALRSGLSRAWLAVAGLTAALGAALWLGGEPGRGVAYGSTSVAVLGFENTTGDSTLAFLCDGLAADLEGDLVQENHLDVASSTEVMKLPANQRSPRIAARRLGVRAVLTGALRRTAGANQLHVELVDGRTGFVHWSAGYDLDAGQAFAVKRQIATAVASSLAAPRTAPRPRTPGRAVPPPAAYEAYLRGIDDIGNLDDPEAPARAAAALDRAVALAPDFSLAWAARSRALAWRYDHEHDAALMAEAENSADIALVLDPGSVQARLARARVYRLTSRVPQALADLDSVVRVVPNWDEAWLSLGDAYRRAGDFDRAESCVRHAVALRPTYTANWHSLGNLMLRRGRYADARAAFGRVAELAPDENTGLAAVASAFVLEGRPREAASVYARLPHPPTNAADASNMATAFFFAGRLEEALKSYLLAVSIEPRDGELRGNLGDCYQRMGRPAEARTQYREAARLDEADLTVSPRDGGLLARHLLHLAKAGERERVWAEYQRHRADISDRDVDIQHSLAKAFALCGRRADAIQAIRKMAALGAATDLLRSEDEFASLRGDPGFRALLPGAAQ